MGKYDEALGFWEHEIAGIKHRLQPLEEDNLDFLRLKKKSQKADDETILFKGVANLYYEMIIRAYPETKETDKEPLRKLIGQNIPIIVNDMMIAFKWTTAEEVAAVKEKVLKKNMDE